MLLLHFLIAFYEFPYICLTFFCTYSTGLHRRKSPVIFPCTDGCLCDFLKTSHAVLCGDEPPLSNCLTISSISVDLCSTSYFYLLACEDAIRYNRMITLFSSWRMSLGKKKCRQILSSVEMVAGNLRTEMEIVKWIDWKIFDSSSLERHFNQLKWNFCLHQPEEWNIFFPLFSFFFFLVG